MPLKRLELAPAAQRQIRGNRSLQVEGLPRSAREGADLTRAKSYFCSHIVDSSQHMLTGNRCSQSTRCGLLGWGITPG
jgi:hypothetical protein